MSFQVAGLSALHSKNIELDKQLAAVSITSSRYQAEIEKLKKENAALAARIDHSKDEIAQLHDRIKVLTQLNNDAEQNQKLAAARIANLDSALIAAAAAAQAKDAQIVILRQDKFFMQKKLDQVNELFRMERIGNQTMINALNGRIVSVCKEKDQRIELLLALIKSKGLDKDLKVWEQCPELFLFFNSEKSLWSLIGKIFSPKNGVSG